MQVHLKLAQILQEHSDAGRGLVKRLAARTGLERHKVSALLNNRVQYVSLEALAKVCDYLVEEHRLRPADLPALLFGIEPELFSAQVANRKHLEIVLGVRTLGDGGRPASRKGKDTAAGRWFAQEWVTASDSMLHGALLHELFGRGQERWQTRPESLEQRLVPAYDGDESLETVKREAESVYDRFQQLRMDRACVSAGSVKSNAVSEIIIAQAFDAEAFTPENDASVPQNRRCPVFFRFRPDDSQPPSCHGGSRLARQHRPSQAGIYYEGADGKWICCPASGHQDAALVLYVHHLLEGRLEIVMAGFSGRASRSLASSLHRLTGHFWPPATGASTCASARSS